MRKYKLWTLLIVLSLLAACKQPQSLTPSVSEVAQIKANGTSIRLFCLTNRNGMAIKVTNFAASLTSVSVPDKKGNFEQVVLGFDSLESYLGKHPKFGATVGRFANRIANAEFVLDGKTCTLEKNEGNNSLHSGKSNWGWRNWHVETFDWNGDPGVVLSLFSPAGDGGFPHAVNCTVSYVLTRDGNLRIDYEATATGHTPINLTNHSYFNLGGAASGTILNHELQLACDRYLEVDSASIPTGRIIDVQGTAFDFTKKKAIGRDIEKAGGYDHCFILARTSQKLSEFASVHEPVSGRTMKISTTLPAVQFYTGNFLKSKEIGKGNVAYPKHAGMCFETQYFPDSMNHPHFPSCIFNKEHAFKHTTIFSFGAK